MCTVLRFKKADGVDRGIVSHPKIWHLKIWHLAVHQITFHQLTRSYFAVL